MHAIGVSTVNALTAHKEWATRPPDERYESVRALHQAALTRRLGTEEHRVGTNDLVLEAVSDDRLALKHKDGSAALTPEIIALADRIYDAIHFIPTSNGGFQIEFHAAGFDVEIEVDEKGELEGTYVSRNRL